ncbi:MAG: hypothetical protein ABW360_11610 [Phenylobacterium sp.]
MDARRVRRPAGLAVLLSLCAAAFASAQPGEVPNPFPVGPSTLPAQVIADCKARPDWTPAHCLAMSGYPAGPREDGDRAAAVVARAAKFACMPQPSAGGWRRISSPEWQKGPDVSVGAIPLAYWHTTAFGLKLDRPADADPPPETLTVRATTDIDLGAFRALVLNSLAAEAPNKDTCEETLKSHDYRFRVHDGIVSAGFDTTVERAACSNYPCVEASNTCIGNICTPQPTTCVAKQPLGQHTVGVDVDIAPKVENGDLVFRMTSRLDERGGLPASLRVLGQLERLWNAATFNVATFRSNNYGIALEQLQDAATRTAAMSRDLFRQRVNVPGLEAYRFTLSQPRMYSVPLKDGSERVRMEVISQADVPATLACPVTTALARYNGVKLGGR